MPGYKPITSFYDDEYAELYYLQTDVPFFLKQMKKRFGSKPLKILEVGCGSGRAVFPLVQAGHNVTGVDYDARIIAKAKQRAAELGMPGSACRFDTQDATKLKLKERFDMACIFFNTFCAFYQPQQQRDVLAGIHRQLGKTGGGNRGGLWIDVFYPDVMLLSSLPQWGLERRTFHSSAMGVKVERVIDVAAHPTLPQVNKLTMRYHWENKNKKEQTRLLKFDLAWFFPRELSALLEAAGFETVASFGSHKGGPLTPRSARIILLAMKR